MRKLNKHILFLFLLTVIISGHSETALGQFLYYDSLTYSQYQNEDWKNLARSSRQAIKKDLDFYYMRMRRGIAFYERGNYMRAEKNFKDAVAFNSIDALAKEYLYYSKLFAGKEKYASQFYFKNQGQLENKIKLQKKAVSYLVTDFLYQTRLENNYESLFDSDEILFIDGTQSVVKSLRIFDFIFEHDLNPSFKLYHGGTFIDKSSYFYLQDAGESYSADLKNIRQLQYFAGLGFFPGADFTFMGLIHYVHNSFPQITFGGRGAGTSLLIPSAKQSFYSSRLSVYKHLSLFKFGGGVSVSNLNFKNQLQFDGHLIIYPFGNQNLYTISSVYRINETDNGDENSYLSIHNTLGIKSPGNIWLEGKIQLGDSRNLVNNDGVYIYNSDEIEHKRYTFSVLIPRQKNTFRIMASYFESYNFYIDGAGNSTNLNKINSTNLSIIGEILWKF